MKFKRLNARQTVTLKSLAQELGLDASTVSMALRGIGKLAPETVRRVKAQAVLRGYKPNQYAAQLASARRHASRVDMPLVALTVDNDKYPTRPCRDGLEKRARELGYTVAFLPMPSIGAARHFFQVQSARGIVGLFLSGWGGEVLEVVPYLEEFAVVACKRYQNELPFALVTHSQFEPMLSAIQRVVSYGYRRIGAAICRHSPLLIDDAEREGAVRYAKVRAPQGVKITEPFLGDHGDKHGFLGWYRRHRPDVVIGFHDGQIEWLRAAGYKVPEDVGFFSLHRDRFQHSTGYEMMDELIGREAVNLLDKLLRYRMLGALDHPYTVSIKPKYKEGHTLRIGRDSPHAADQCT